MTPNQLAELHARCFETPRSWSADEFSDLSKTSFLKTEADGFLVGRVIADEAELLTLAVEPDARRTGVGRRLVEEFLRESRELSAAQAFLEVAADNVAAITLYEQSGFCEAGRRRSYYTCPDGTKLDALIMTRIIAPL